MGMIKPLLAFIPSATVGQVFALKMLSLCFLLRETCLLEDICFFIIIENFNVEIIADFPHFLPLSTYPCLPYTTLLSVSITLALKRDYLH